MLRDIDDLVRDNVKSLKPFSSAREEYSGDADVFIDANESPFENTINRYPDPYQRLLKKTIGEWKGISEEKIFLGNGSDEIIDLLIRCFCEPGRDIVRFLEPSFGMYEVSADINNVIKQSIPLTNLFDLDAKAVLSETNENHKILFLCSPNNPSGNELSREAIFDILKTWPGLVVIDEAYHDFTNSKSFMEQLDDFPNLVVLQTFSKGMGAAGIRLGLCFTNPGVVGYLNKVKPPYNISSETQKIAFRLLSDLATYEKQKSMLIKSRVLLFNKLQTISCIKHVFPSVANFLLVRVENAQKVKEHLLQNGIVVRDRSQQLHCANCLRITVGTDYENSLLISALENFSKG